MIGGMQLVRAAVLLATLGYGAVQADTAAQCGADRDCLRQLHAAHPVVSKKIVTLDLVCTYPSLTN